MIEVSQETQASKHTCIAVQKVKMTEESMHYSYLVKFG